MPVTPVTPPPEAVSAEASTWLMGLGRVGAGKAVTQPGEHLSERVDCLADLAYAPFDGGEAFCDVVVSGAQQCAPHFAHTL